MKKQDITYQDKINELRLDISHPKSKGIAFILLEGESDVRLFRKLFNLENCKVEIIPGGKMKLEECVSDLVKIYPLLIGIRDADFLHLKNQQYTAPNIFLTDFHDMEMSIISENDIFCSLCFEHTNLTIDKHLDVRDDIMISIQDLGYLKCINEEEILEFNFDPGFQELVSFDNLSIDIEQYLSRVFSKSPNAKITDVPEILQKIDTIKEKKFNLLQITNGHDFIRTFLQYIRKKAGGNVGHDVIASSLRMAYTSNHFASTELFKRTSLWGAEMGCAIYP